MYIHSSCTTILLVFALLISNRSCHVKTAQGMQIGKHCFELSRVSDKMNSLGSMAMPETLLITKAFDRALANEVSISYAE